ncbi:MAG: hypothetical protein HYV15_01145 [Elusimicrobia bacterium]|nr:hypothetical protein [Elusimicrobiota bacterium]
MKTLALAAVLLGAPCAAHADALRHAALAVLLVRENPSAEGRRGALDLAFDASVPRAGDAEAVVDGGAGPRRSWFPKKRLWGPERPAFRMPALPPAPASDGFGDAAVRALGAALAPWRRLADSAWSGAWAGLVSVGRADQHGR